MNRKSKHEKTFFNLCPIKHKFSFSPKIPKRETIPFYNQSDKNQVSQRSSHSFKSIAVDNGKNPSIQPKLSISNSNDREEQEADRMAETVMTMPDSQFINRQEADNEINPKIARRQKEEKEYEKINPKLLQRLAGKEDEKEEVINLKATSRGVISSQSTLKSSLNSLQNKGEALPESTRSFFESRFNNNFSSVRVHRDSPAAESAKSINAKAFTYGSNIVFGEGQYSPETNAGKKLIAHELGHVLQQRHSVKSTLSGDVWRKKEEQTFFGLTYSNINWATLLQDTDEYNKAKLLNIFMAKALGHDVYERESDLEDRKKQADHLKFFPVPSEAECIRLMSAFLTAKNIDLREIGALSPVTGYLLSKFVKKYYSKAINDLTQKARSKEKGWDEFEVKPGAVGDLIDEGGDVESDFQSLYEEAHWDPKMPIPTPEKDKTSEIGVTKQAVKQPGVKETLIAEILANIMVNATAGVGAAISGDTGKDWGQYKDRIEMHAKVFSGIVNEVKRVEKINAKIIEVIISLAFAGLGPMVSNVVVFGKSVQKEVVDELKETLTESVAKSMALEFTKDRAVALGKSLSKCSSDQLRSRMRSDFNKQMHAYEFRLRQGSLNKREWERAYNAIDQLQNSFYHHT